MSSGNVDSREKQFGAVVTEVARLETLMDQVCARSGELRDTLVGPLSPQQRSGRIRK